MAANSVLHARTAVRRRGCRSVVTMVFLSWTVCWIFFAGVTFRLCDDQLASASVGLLISFVPVVALWGRMTAYAWCQQSAWALQADSDFVEVGPGLAADYAAKRSRLRGARRHVEPWSKLVRALCLLTTLVMAIRLAWKRSDDKARAHQRSLRWSAFADNIERGARVSPRLLSTASPRSRRQFERWLNLGDHLALVGAARCQAQYWNDIAKIFAAIEWLRADAPDFSAGATVH